MKFSTFDSQVCFPIKLTLGAKPKYLREHGVKSGNQAPTERSLKNENVIYTIIYL